MLVWLLRHAERGRQTRGRGHGIGVGELLW
jgi:hypothetical protein